MAKKEIQVASIFYHRLPEKKKNNVLRIPEFTCILKAQKPYGAIMTVDWDQIHNLLNACF